MKTLWKIISSFLWALLLSAIIAFLIVGAIKERITHIEIDKEAFLREIQPTTILYDNEEVLARFYGERRGLASYEEIPKEIIDAVISIEDREFASHPGINVKAIFRAAIEIAKADGDLVQGGSTITQQLVKMTLLTTEKTLERKIEEAILATIVEKNYTKEEILEMYLNEMFYGNQAYGIKDATRTYFGQDFKEFVEDPRDVRIAKAAMLVGMLQSPTTYSPYNNYVYDEEKAERTLNRRNTVIWAMKENGVITQEEYEKALEHPLMILKEANTFFEEEEFGDKELVQYSLHEASEILEMTTREVMDSGYQIYTSFNPDIYDIIRETVETSKNFPRDAKDGTKAEVAVVFLNPKTGEIMGFTGGREELTNFQGFNRAFMAERQPGSTLKPVIAYGPALESGKFNEFSLLLDKKGTSFNGYVPRDWDGGGRGWVTMQEALRMSWNIPAVWTLNEVGIDYATEFAYKLGIDLRNDNSGLPMALGGVGKGVTPLQMADSYQAFANEGIRTPAHAIRKIVDKNGEVIYEAKIETDSIIKPSTAITMKGMLQNIVDRGIAAKAKIPGRKIAGKTGTTQYPEVPKANRDIWFVGFDEEVLGAVWMGFDHTTPNRYLVDGSGITASLFKEITVKILNYLEENKDVSEPEDLMKEPPDETPPVINLIGEETVTIERGEIYEDAGATAEDDKDGDLTEYIRVQNNVNIDKPGTYTVTYTVMDKSGNESRKIRTVIVKNPQPVQIGSVSVYYDDEENAVQMSWEPFRTDRNVLYAVKRDGEVISMSSRTKYQDKNISDNTVYHYEVVVMEEDTGHILARSNSTKVETKTVLPDETEQEDDELENEETESDEETREDNDADENNEEEI